MQMACSECLKGDPTVGYFELNHIGALGALMNRVLQPRPLVVLGLTVWMGTAAGADELVEIPYLDGREPFRSFRF